MVGFFLVINKRAMVKDFFLIQIYIYTDMMFLQGLLKDAHLGRNKQLMS